MRVARYIDDVGILQKTGRKVFFRIFFCYQDATTKMQFSLLGR